VGDDDDVLSEAAKAMGTCGSAQELTWMAPVKKETWFTSTPGDRGNKNMI